MVKYSQQEVKKTMKLSLAEARRLRGKRQCDMAKILGGTVQTYRRLERNPELLKVKDIQILSEYLNMPLRDFLFIPDDGKK